MPGSAAASSPRRSVTTEVSTSRKGVLGRATTVGLDVASGLVVATAAAAGSVIVMGVSRAGAAVEGRVLP